MTLITMHVIGEAQEETVGDRIDDCVFQKTRFMSIAAFITG